VPNELRTAISMAIKPEHGALAETAANLLAKYGSVGAARAALEAPVDRLPAFWDEIARLGWLGLHVPERYGGAGFGLPELTIIVEQMGRALAPGPFLPTVIANAVLAEAGSAAAAEFAPRLVDGSRTAGVAFEPDVVLHEGVLRGRADIVLDGGVVDLLLVPCGADVAVVDVRSDGVHLRRPAALDPSRPCAVITFDAVPATVVAGAATSLRDIGRIVLSAEAAGVARRSTELAADYARLREQFGRPIGTFQAVKHHCANMLVATELATAAVWDAARASVAAGKDRAVEVQVAERSRAAAIAATLAATAGYLCADLDIQVHGGIGYTWEHDAHLYLRRATVLRGLLEPERAAADATALVRAGVRRRLSVDLPPAAEGIRTEVRSFVDRVKDVDPETRRTALVDEGYAMPHWPRPWGRDASAVEQLVIEQEFAAAAIKRPVYSITGWVILTLIQHGTPEQVTRWVPPALAQDVIWCQLFSEPAAGSDAAGIRTRATRVEGGWLLNGQKVWTSGGHVARHGFATVRTDPDAPKHAGITTMVIDMQAPGVEVRPLRMTTGAAEFNEVFLSDVFVPDDDVVGPVDGGWQVARATLGNESVSIGSGQGGGDMGAAPEVLLTAFDAHRDRLAGGEARVGRYIAHLEAMQILNLRGVHRAVAGAAPGAEGSVTKLLLSELAQEAAAILAALSGPRIALMEDAAETAGQLVLSSRALSIAGGTSEIKRNQIGERLLGLPRDPLMK
jgi:alkylation response protein AidB-like acyl-CoA dehydrogenase